MTPIVNPITPLYLRYRAMGSADQAERLRYARDVLANPAWLAEEFVTTVLRLGEYDNADQHFYGKRDAHKFGRDPDATKDLVLRLEALPSVTPVDASDRQVGGTGSGRLRAFSESLPNGLAIVEAAHYRERTREWAWALATGLHLGWRSC